MVPTQKQLRRGYDEGVWTAGEVKFPLCKATISECFPEMLQSTERCLQCRLMVRALFLMFLSLVYRRDPFLARCYIQCTHPLLARLLDVIKCSIMFMLMTLSYILRSGRLLFLI